MKQCTPLVSKLYERYVKKTFHHSGVLSWQRIDDIAADWKKSGQPCKISSYIRDNVTRYSSVLSLEQFTTTLYKNPRFAIYNTEDEDELLVWCSENGFDFETCRRMRDNVILQRKRGLVC